MYIELWFPEIYDTGASQKKCLHVLAYSSIPHSTEAISQDEKWSIMCPYLNDATMNMMEEDELIFPLFLPLL